MSCVTSHRLAAVAVSLAILFLIPLIASLSRLGSDGQVMSPTEIGIIQKRALKGNLPDESHEENSTVIVKGTDQVGASRNDNESELRLFMGVTDNGNDDDNDAYQLYKVEKTKFMWSTAYVQLLNHWNDLPLTSAYITT